MVDDQLDAPATPVAAAGIGSVALAVRDEISGLRPRILLLTGLLRLLPPLSFIRVRSTLMRMAGFSIGAGSSFFGAPKLRGGPDLHRNLQLGAHCEINEGAHFDLSGEIIFEDRVVVAQEVLFVTNSHKVGDDARRSGQTTVLPILIKSGTWIGARATILPGVTIGEGAVVAAGAIVTADVPAHSLVAGVPAVVRRDLRNPSG